MFPLLLLHFVLLLPREDAKVNPGHRQSPTNVKGGLRLDFATADQLKVYEGLHPPRQDIAPGFIKRNAQRRNTRHQGSAQNFVSGEFSLEGEVPSVPFRHRHILSMLEQIVEERNNRSGIFNRTRFADSHECTERGMNGCESGVGNTSNNDHLEVSACKCMDNKTDAPSHNVNDGSGIVTTESVQETVYEDTTNMTTPSSVRKAIISTPDTNGTVLPHDLGDEVTLPCTNTGTCVYGNSEPTTGVPTSETNFIASNTDRYQREGTHLCRLLRTCSGGNEEIPSDIFTSKANWTISHSNTSDDERTHPSTSPGTYSDGNEDISLEKSVSVNRTISHVGNDSEVALTCKRHGECPDDSLTEANTLDSNPSDGSVLLTSEVGLIIVRFVSCAVFIMSAVGVPCNILGILAFINSPRKNSTSVFIIALFMFDFWNIVACVGAFVSRELSRASITNNWKVQFLIITYYTLGFSTVIRKITTCIHLIISFERFLVILKPFVVRKSRRLHLLMLFLLVLLGCLASFPVVFRFQILEIPDPYTNRTVVAYVPWPIFKQNWELFVTFGFVTKVMLTYVPLILILSILIVTGMKLKHYRKIRRAMIGSASLLSNSEKQITKVNLLFTFTFMLLSLPAIITAHLSDSFPEFGPTDRESTLYKTLMQLWFMCDVLASTVGFWFYYCISLRFRVTLKRVICRRAPVKPASRVSAIS